MHKITKLDFEAKKRGNVKRKGHYPHYPVKSQLSGSVAPIWKATVLLPSVSYDNLQWVGLFIGSVLLEKKEKKSNLWKQAWLSSDIRSFLAICSCTWHYLRFLMLFCSNSGSVFNLWVAEGRTVRTTSILAIWSSHLATFTIIISHLTMVKNIKKHRCKYWATRSSIRSHR